MPLESPDVNVLLYAFRRESPDHPGYRRWLTERLATDEPFGVSDLVLSALVRLTTNPRIFDPPATVGEAFRFCAAVMEAPNVERLSPGPRHWAHFERLCLTYGLNGGDVADAYLAALAIEHGATWITADRGFARFAGLRTRHPFDA